MAKRNQASSQSPEQLIDDLRSLLADAEKVVTETAPDKLEDKLQAMRSGLENARERLEDFYHNAKDKVTEGAKQADQTIRSHPYESLAIALGIGVLLGALLRRDR